MGRRSRDAYSIIPPFDALRMGHPAPGSEVMRLVASEYVGWKLPPVPPWGTVLVMLPAAS